MNQKILGEKRKSNFDDTLADVVNKMYDNMPNSPSDGFSVEEGNSLYTLRNVQYAGDLVDVYWHKELFDRGAVNTWAEWKKRLRLSNKIVLPTNLSITTILPPSDLYFASLLKLYENRNGLQSDLIEQIRGMFFKDFNGDSGHNFMMTGSRVVYNNKNITHKEKDFVIHRRDLLLDDVLNLNFAIKGERLFNKEYVASEIISENEKEITKQIQALFGTEDLQKINDVFKWVSGKSSTLSMICRRNKELKKRVITCPVSMGVYGIGDRFVINTHFKETFSAQARGVFVVTKTPKTITEVMEG